ncbi:MAG: PilT/PilU family type 4a pilus ATPase [Oscillospiraceae bacterium]|nr:PilT/PilU family type 4a pilus ATPase [Oscillospiraceae bacterium]
MIDAKEAILEYLKRAVELRVSDIFIGAGRKITFKVNGALVAQDGDIIKPDDSMKLISGLYELASRPMTRYNESGDDDFPVTIPGVARFRVNTYRQRSTMAAIIRVVMFNIPDYKDLFIPDAVMNIAKEVNGLALVTGPAGSGKSTTLACIIDAINKTRNSHIITLEDPIEFLHRDNESLVSQREIFTDTNSYSDALRAALRQSPDIILLGEMRDHETVRTAITAAETGHLVISTLHTIGAANTIDRIVDIFPPIQQQQIRVQLSMSLKMVVTQRLVKRIDGTTVPAFEVMSANPAIKNIIREGKTHQINAVIQTSSAEGMISLDTYILQLLKNGEITVDTALLNASNHDQMQQQITALGLR